MAKLARVQLRLVSAPAAARVETADLGADRPLRVITHPCFWQFEGTRAQLEAENVLSTDTKWPEAGQELIFKVGRFRYWLRRIRPDGATGPMKVWKSGDWWGLRCELIDFPDIFTLRIREKSRELAEAMHHLSLAGRRERSVQVGLACKAIEDEAYQSFKNLIPGLVPPKRGRKPKPLKGV